MTNNIEELRNILATQMKKPVKLASDQDYATGYWPTGSLPIDAVLGGGWVKGRMALLTGESQTLKSRIAYESIASVQRNGGTTALIDTERAFNPDWAMDLGIDLDQLILIQPEVAEEAIDQMEVLIRNEIDMIVFDSIAAMLPASDRAIQLSGKDNPQPARIAALMSIALRKLNSANLKSQILWVTQKRANIGGMAFSPKTNDTGGKAIEFYVSQKLELKKTNKIKEAFKYWNGAKEENGERLVAQGFRAELTKSRNRQPFAVSHFLFDYDLGEIDMINFLMGEARISGDIDIKGAWWYFTDVDSNGEILGEYKGQGKDNFYKEIDENPAAYNALLTSVARKFNLEASNYGLRPDEAAESEGVHAVLEGGV
jgi:recombination protein RecA